MGIKEGYTVVKCGRCSSLYSPVLPKQYPHYEDHYWEEILPELVHRRSREIVATFEKFRETGLLLDVGCGSGAMLKAAVDAGWRAQGLEIASSAVETLREQGFEVKKTPIEEANFSDSSIDVIVANGVIEHVHYPDTFLASCFRFLRPGGLLYITTPNALGTSVRLLGIRWTAVSPNDHVHLFSMSGITTLLRSHGFQIERVAAEGANPLELLHALRDRSEESGFDRVGSAYLLNETFSSSKPRLLIKGLINRLLTTTRLGDELKIYSTK